MYFPTTVKDTVVEKFQQHPAIHLVLLDLIMPKMNGEQCFLELRTIDWVTAPHIASSTIILYPPEHDCLSRLCIDYPHRAIRCQDHAAVC